MSRLKSFATLVGLALSMATLGTAGGMTVRSALASDEISAGCEQDECEGGTTCKQNSGRNTLCDMTGPGACATDACGAT
jgi:hypothetical protein